MADINMVRAAIQQSLKRIGNHNGHACPATSSNVDGPMHKLMVAQEGMAYFKDAKEAAEAELLNIAFDDGEYDELVTRVTDNMRGEDVKAAEGDVYECVVSLSKPSNRLNSKALRSYLRTQLGLSEQQVNDAFDASSSMAKPAKRVKIIAR